MASLRSFLRSGELTPRHRRNRRVRAAHSIFQDRLEL
jgi:hypothetical protein